MEGAWGWLRILNCWTVASFLFQTERPPAARVCSEPELATCRQVTCSALRPVQAEGPAGPRDGTSALRTADLYITKFYDTPSTAYLLLRQVLARCCSFRLQALGPWLRDPVRADQLLRTKAVSTSSAKDQHLLSTHVEGAPGWRLAACFAAPEKLGISQPDAWPVASNTRLKGSRCGQQQRQVMLADSSLLTSILDKVAPFKVRQRQRAELRTHARRSRH